MKNIVKLMFASVALVALPAAAQAQCNLIAGGNTSLDALLTFNGQPAPAPAMQVAPLAAEALMKVPAYKTAVAGCTEADVARELSRLNWPDSSKLISVSDQFIVPKLAPVVQAPTPDTTVVVTVSETPTVKPVAEPSAELRRTQAELQSAKQQQNVLKAQVAAIAARPKNTQLSPADRAKVDQLLKVNGEVKSLETRLRAYVDAENAKQNVAIAKAGTDAATAKADAAEAKKIALAAENAAKAAAAEKVGWTWFDLGLGIFSLLLVGGLAWLYFRKPKKADVRTVVDEALKDESLGHTVFRAELDALKGEVEKLSTDVADSAKDHKQVELPANLEEQLKALGEGESTEIVSTISGNRGLIGFTKSGENFVTTTDIDKQTQPMNIEKISKHGCGIRSTLLRHIGAGRVKLRPIAQAVNS